MSDRGERYTDKKISQIDRQLSKTYRTAQKELEQKLKSFNQKFAAKDKQKRKDMHDGKISKQEYKDWLAGQVFMRSQFEDKIRQVQQVMLHHDKYAAQIINEGRLDVFAENYYAEAFRANWIIQGIDWNIYNTQALERLIESDPQLLPEWKIDEKKDYTWNYNKVNNIVKQGIIQGESIDQITDRLCKDLCTQDENRMRLFARTAMTGAQNAGRQAQMQQAADMDIEVNKRWIATLDSRTRDSHRGLDGEEVPYDEDFSNGLEYPGDPSGAPEEVYNCRCTMQSVYPKYEDRSKQWREGVEIDGESYEEWKEGKKAQQVEKPEEEKTINGYKVDDEGRLVVDVEDMMKKGQQAEEENKKLYDELVKEERSLFEEKRAIAEKDRELDKLSKALGDDYSLYKDVKTEEDYGKLIDETKKQLASLQDQLEKLERPRRENFKTEEEYDKAYDKYIHDKIELRAAKEETESRYYKLWDKSWADVERRRKAEEMGLEGIKAERARLNQRSEEVTERQKANYEKRKGLADGRKNFDMYTLVSKAEADKVAYDAPKVLEKARSFDEIVARLGGADRTEGSCVSLALCYIGQKNGIDVLDFRDGSSRSLFSSSWRSMMRGLAQETGKPLYEDTSSTATAAPVRLAKTMQEGKEYCFLTGRHAAIMRKKDGNIEYLELQSNHKGNGWQRLSYSGSSEDRKDLEKGFAWRFGTSKYWKGESLMMDIEDMKDSMMLQKSYGYMNTAEDKQHKGAGGGVK